MNYAKPISIKLLSSTSISNRAILTNLVTLVLVACIVLPVEYVNAQDLEQLEKEPKVKVTGDFGVRLGAYNAWGIDNRRDPFSYLITGGVDFDIAGWHIPFRFTFSQQETVFLQPFHHYGVSPTYKWVKLHLGYRSMRFSPYSLNGHQFLGVGGEFELPTNRGPKIFIAGMYGRFRRKVEVADAILNDGEASYARKGYGAMVKLTGRTNSRNYISVDILQAKDDENSFDGLLADFTIQPEENFVLGFDAQYNPFSKVILRGSYGFSAHTLNTGFEQERKDVPTILKPFAQLFDANQSTEYTDAMKFSADYNAKTFTAGVQFERIDPSYESFGTYYFNNDVEHLTVRASTSIRKWAMSLSGSLGLQRNNLDEVKNTQTKRVIGSINISQSLAERFSYALSFNNYSSSLKVVREQLTDSLNVYQITRSATLNLNYLTSPNSGNTVVYALISAQKGNQRDEYEIYDNVTSFFQTNLGIRWRNPAKYLTLNGAFIYSIQKSVFDEDYIWGPTFSVNRQMFRRRASVGYTLTLSNNTKGGGAEYWLMDNRFDLGYKIEKVGSVKLTVSFIDKADQHDSGTSYSELRAILGYNYKF